MKGNNFVPQVTVKCPTIPKEEKRKTPVLVFERLSEDEKNIIKKACFDASLYKQDKLGFASMEEYEANNKTTIFDSKLIRSAIYDVILSRLSKDGTMDIETLETYVNNIIKFNIGNLRAVRDCIEGVMYRGEIRDSSFPYYQSSKQIDVCLDEFMLPGEIVELSNDEITERLKISDKKKSRIKEFCYNDEYRDYVHKDARFFDYPKLEKELIEMTFIKLLQISGVKAEEVFNYNFNKGAIQTKAKNIYRKNCKTIQLFLEQYRRWINQPLSEEQINKFIDKYTIPIESEREIGRGEE